MMKLFFALSGIALSTVAMAQSTGMPPYTPDPGPTKGDWEAAVAGTGASDESFDNTDFAAAGSIGYYLTKNIPLSFRQRVFFSEVNDSTQIDGSSIFQAAYQWDLARWQPYLGLNLGGQYGAGVTDAGLWGPEGGVKYFVNESTFLFGSVGYEMEIDSCCNDGRIPYQLGVGFDF